MSQFGVMINKYIVFLFLNISLLSLLSCGDTDTNKEPLIEPDSNAIYIYFDTIGWESKSPCKIKYRGQLVEGGLKYRGGASSRYDKHSFTMELSQELSIAGLEANDDWILNANYIDKTFQRHKLSYDIWRQMDKKNISSRCEYIEVYVNDKYIGLYVLMEKINGSYLSLSQEDETSVLFKDPLVFIKERMTNVQDSNNYYQQKYPKHSVSDRNGYMEEFKQLLFNGNQNELETLLPRWIDVDNVIDWHLLLLLTNNDDGIVKNFYLYKRNENTPMRFIPWDYDHSFGRDGDNAMNMMEREVGWEKVVLLSRLMDDVPSIQYRTKLKKRWIELREDVFTERYIYGMIDKNDQIVRPFVNRNFQLWPNDSKWYHDSNNYIQEIDLMKEFVAKRIPYLDSLIQTF